MFEDWGGKKLNKYDVDIEAYNHTNIRERPSILIDSYSKKKVLDSDIFVGRG